MANFDYITAKEFRESLEADYSEMRNCVEVQSWKSVQVLAGSIVETLLIDYLSATRNPKRPKKDPLRFDLSEAITICKDEKVLSERTADLCSVVKSYRNLIHPGRMVRLEEQAPNKGSATIALALIDMITDDLARTLRSSVGLTAEQILSKLQRDPNSLNILKHLLTEVSEPQRERLLVELIPMAHQEARAAANPSPFVLDDPFAKEANLLESAYRVILETMPTDSRNRIALEFVRVLREEDGQSVLRYGKAFFLPSDMKFLSMQNMAMVREHLVGNAPGIHTLDSAKYLSGIGEFIDQSHVVKWIDPFVRALVSSIASEAVKTGVRNYLLQETLHTTTDVDVAVSRRLVDWINHFDNSNDKPSSDVVKSLKKDIEELQIPF